MIVYRSRDTEAHVPSANGFVWANCEKRRIEAISPLTTSLMLANEHSNVEDGGLHTQYP
jgi:hypothetical protein